MKISILYVDNAIIVVEKPGGMLSVPGRGVVKQDCLASRLQQLFPDMPLQPAVHRLDMYTSGVMVFARTKNAHRALSQQFMQRQVRKVYEAIVEGNVRGNRGIIRLSFRLDTENRPLQIYDPIYGKKGITRWEKISSQTNYGTGELSSETTYLRLFPETGRTHQLRTHLAHPYPFGLGTPIVGDSLYGNGNDGDTMLLHATELMFFHPENGDPLCFSSTSQFSYKNS